MSLSFTHWDWGTGCVMALQSPVAPEDKSGFHLELKRRPPCIWLCLSICFLEFRPGKACLTAATYYLLAWRPTRTILPLAKADPASDPIDRVKPQPEPTERRNIKDTGAYFLLLRAEVDEADLLTEDRGLVRDGGAVRINYQDLRTRTMSLGHI